MNEPSAKPKSCFRWRRDSLVRRLPSVCKTKFCSGLQNLCFESCFKVWQVWKTLTLAFCLWLAASPTKLCICVTLSQISHVHTVKNLYYWPEWRVLVGLIWLSPKHFKCFSPLTMMEKETVCCCSAVRLALRSYIQPSWEWCAESGWNAAHKFYDVQTRAICSPGRGAVSSSFKFRLHTRERRRANVRRAVQQPSWDFIYRFKFVSRSKWLTDACFMLRVVTALQLPEPC